MSDHAARLARNADSKADAANDREPWSADDVEFLLEFFGMAKGDVDDEVEVASALGRTIEACRQRFYEVTSGRKPRHVIVRKTTTTTSTTRTEYIGAADDPDDQWWSTGYYNS